MSCALIGLLESCLAALLMTSFTFPSFTLSLVKEKKKTKFSCNFCLFFLMQIPMMGCVPGFMQLPMLLKFWKERCVE